MAFAPVFQRTLGATFDPCAAAAAVPWYLAGSAPTPIAVYQPKGAASLAASYTNLVNPGTYDAAPGAAPTFDGATGWTAPTFDGATGWTFSAGASPPQYLKTGIVPASGWSIIARFASVTNTGYVMGCYSGGNTRIYLRPDTTGDQLRYGNGGVVFVTPRLLAGVLAVAGQQGYRNGTADGGSIDAWSGTGTADLAIGGMNDTGTTGITITASVQAIAIYNTILTAAQVLAISTAMAAL